MILLTEEPGNGRAFKQRVEALLAEGHELVGPAFMLDTEEGEKVAQVLD
jgi:hypothetical protein